MTDITLDTLSAQITQLGSILGTMDARITLLADDVAAVKADLAAVKDSMHTMDLRYAVFTEQIQLVVLRLDTQASMFRDLTGVLKRWQARTDADLAPT